MKIQDYISSQLKSAMRDQELQQSDIVAKTQLSAATVSKVLNGTNGKISTIDKICNALSLKIVIEAKN